MSQDLVLEEVRLMRADIAKWQIEQEKRLTVLETHDEEMQDNGQPGWKTITDKRLTRLETRLALFTGAGMAIGALFHLAIDIFKK